MSSDFVRYSPEIETIDPHIDELMAQIIDFWEKKGRESPHDRGQRAGRPRRAREVIWRRQGGGGDSRATCRRRMRRASTPSRATTAP